MMMRSIVGHHLLVGPAGVRSFTTAFTGKAVGAGFTMRQDSCVVCDGCDDCDG